MKPKVRTLVIVSAVIVLCGIGGYVFRKPLALWMFDLFYSKSVAKQLENTYQPIEGREEEAPTEKPKIQEPFSVLLLGIDQRGKEVGRSDTIIYSVVRPEDHRILMISIPRDAYVELVGRGEKDKITHAYAFGGAKMSIDTVEQLLDAPIHHYGAINFRGFVEMVDLLGGLKLNLDGDLINRDPSHERLEVRAGKELYTGEEALGFVRYREGPGGDYARTQRHQELMYALMDKVEEAGNITKIPEMVAVLGDHFQTSMRPEYMMELAKMFVEWDVKQISGYTLKGAGARLGKQNLWYHLLNEQDLEDVKQLISRWLDPETRADRKSVV